MAYKNPDSQTVQWRHLNWTALGCLLAQTGSLLLLSYLVIQTAQTNWMLGNLVEAMSR